MRASALAPAVISLARLSLIAFMHNQKFMPVPHRACLGTNLGVNVRFWQRHPVIMLWLLVYVGVL